MSLATVGSISLAFFLALAANAQSAGTICVTVHDRSGAVVVGAIAELNNGETHLGARTDSAGQFCLDDLQPGDYQLAVRSPGFEEKRQDLIVRAGEAARLTVILDLQTVAQQENDESLGNGLSWRCGTPCHSRHSYPD